MNSQPFTAAFHNTLVPDIPGNSSVSSVMPGYPENVLSGGGKRSNRKRSRGKINKVTDNQMIKDNPWMLDDSAIEVTKKMYPNYFKKKKKK